MTWTLHTVLAALVLMAVCGSTTVASEVYVKLLPGREFCVNYEAFRNPEAEPAKVSFQHRALDPRLAGIRTTLYAPGSEPGQRGRELPLEGTLDTFGDVVSLFFDAEESGTYTLCFISPTRQPIMRFEMNFAASNDYVEPPTTEDGTIVVDKPTEVKDYDDRLHMLDVCVKTTNEELRMYQMRRFMFDHTMESTFYAVVASVLLNVVLAVGLSVWSEKYLERFFIKQKVA